METNSRISNAVRFVAIANLLYFGIEFFFALKGNSISLFADSIDFLEDASINFLILIGLGWAAEKRAKLGMFLAGIIMIPAAVTIWKAIEQFLNPTVPSSEIVSFTGAGALAVNVIYSFWPDLIVGVGIAALNADAAKEVWEASRDEIAESKA